jgi:hypothetical protein
MVDEQHGKKKMSVITNKISPEALNSTFFVDLVALKQLTS